MSGIADTGNDGFAVITLVSRMSQIGRMLPDARIRRRPWAGCHPEQPVTSDRYRGVHRCYCPIDLVAIKLP
jgi:hypothetical protein